MYFLEEIIDHTNRLLEEEKRREKVLKEILHVLKMVSGQREHTKSLMRLMLEYEKCRQKKTMEQKWMQRKISEEQKKEYERSIQLYEEYVELLTKQKGV